MCTWPTQEPSSPRYIVAFWLPAEAMHVFFTVKHEPHLLSGDNKVWGFFALASINWLGTTSLIFVMCVASDPCPTRLIEIAIFCFSGCPTSG